MSTADQPAQDPRPASRRRLGLLRSTVGPLVALGAVVLFFSLADSLFGHRIFVSVDNFRNILVQTSTVAVAALGMTLVIIAGGIDLSAGTALALCATVLAWGIKEDLAVLCLHGDNLTRATARLAAANTQLESTTQDKAARSQEVERRQAELAATREATARWNRYTPYAALAAGILTGGLVGFINGALISLLRVVPFIVTLGTMTIYLGVAKLIAQETTIRPPLARIPAWIPELVRRQPDPWWLFVPTGVWFLAVLAVVLSAVLGYSVFGRHVFAVGSSEATARLCGINVPRVKIAVYTISGLFIGIAGAYQFARLSTGNPTSGIGMELKVIAAVVIGGGSLNGGQGSVLGTLTGAAIMAAIASGCTLLGLSNPIQDIIIGAIIVAAVTLDQVRQRRLAG